MTDVLFPMLFALGAGGAARLLFPQAKRVRLRALTSYIIPGVIAVSGADVAAAAFAAGQVPALAGWWLLLVGGLLLLAVGTVRFERWVYGLPALAQGEDTSEVENAGWMWFALAVVVPVVAWWVLG